MTLHFLACVGTAFWAGTIVGILVADVGWWARGARGGRLVR